jgi:hypothetical protein
MLICQKRRSLNKKCVQEYRLEGFYWLGQNVLVYDIGRMRLLMYLQELLLERGWVLLS